MAIKAGTGNIKSIIYGGNTRIYKCYKGSNVIWEKEIFPGYLTFSSPSSFTLSIFTPAKYWDGTLEWSTDKTTWNEWLGTNTLSSVASSGTHYLYIRGTDNTYITGTGTGILRAPSWVLTGSNVSCSGSIEALLNYTDVLNDTHPTMASKCFYGLFCFSTSLISAPKLTALTAYDYCYSQMFYQCTSLITPPIISATTLAPNCCEGMFQGCTSLTTTPILRSTVMATTCYKYMFYGCTALTTPPSLSGITRLASDCYHSMFYGCTALTRLPKMFAKNSGVRAYFNMFANCNQYLASKKSSTFVNPVSFKIPYNGDGSYGYTNELNGMFTGTDIGTPTMNTTYYTGYALVE